MSDRDCKRRLADTSGADDGDKALRVQTCRQLLKIILAIDHFGEATRQVRMPKTCFQSLWGWLCSSNRETGATKQ